MLCNETIRLFRIIESLNRGNQRLSISIFQFFPILFPDVINTNVPCNNNNNGDKYLWLGVGG